MIPFSVGAMTKVGPQNIFNAGGEVSGEVSGEVLSAEGVKLDKQKVSVLLQYCREPRSRTEMQLFCGIKSQDYFRRSILMPLLNSGLLKRTIPDKPKSSNQKYVKA